jgi:hypothetical protein
MGLRRTIAFGFLLAAAPVAAMAACPAATSPDYYAVPKEYARAKQVALVRVESETWLEGADRNSLSGVLYDVRVLKDYKGGAPARLKMRSDTEAGRLRMAIGEAYLVFLNQEDGGGLGLDSCGNSAPASQAGPALSQVKALSRR